MIDTIYSPTNGCTGKILHWLPAGKWSVPPIASNVYCQQLLAWIDEPKWGLTLEPNEPAAKSGTMGKGKSQGKAIADFAVVYADQRPRGVGGGDRVRQGCC